MKRSGNVDCAKFIAALMIMLYHTYNTGVIGLPGRESWIYVEFFLLITGYYTARHFSGVSADNRSKEAFLYTVRKIMPLFPYALITSLAGWITQGISGMIFQGWTWKEFLTNFTGDFVFDLMMISDTYSYPLIAPLWYISALMLTFPFFCLYMQVKNRYTKLLVSTFLPLMYYGWIGVTGNRAFPHDILRVMAGLMLGSVLYEISVIFRDQISRIPKAFLTFVEFAAFFYPAYCSYRGMAERGLTTTRLYYLCFFVFLLLCLPGFTHSASIKGRLFNYLGRLSMPMFITHWYVGTVIKLFAGHYGWANNLTIAIYFVLTLIVSAVLMLLFDSGKSRNGSIRKNLVLID